MKMKHLLIYKIARDIKNLCAGSARCAAWYARQIGLTIQDHRCDRRLGIETSAPFRFRDNSAHNDMSNYLGAPYEKIRRIAGYLALGPEDIFIDLGCGSGRVVFFIAAGKLKKVIGVELNEEAVRAARQNCLSLKIRNSPVEFVHADAAEADLSRGTVFFMYNPFGHRTLRSVVDNIKKSLKENPRKIRIVDYGLTNRHILDGEGWLEPEKEMDGGEIVIWRSRPQAPLSPEYPSAIIG